jgi:hypothetical protein
MRRGFKVTGIPAPNRAATSRNNTIGTDASARSLLRPPQADYGLP